MKETDASNRLWSSQFTLAILMTVGFFLSLQLLTAGLPAYIADIKDNPAQGGLMTTVFMLSAILTRPVIGFILPKVNMKIMNIVTLIALTFLILLSYGQESVEFLLVLRVFHGICFGILSTSIATMATSVIPVKRLGEGIGYYGMATSGGTSFAPMIALAILQDISYNFLILISASLIVITLILMFFVKGPTKNNATGTSSVGSEKAKKISFKEYAFDKKAILPCSLAFFFTLTLGGVTSFLKGLGSEANISSTVSLFFLVQAIVLIISKAISGIIYDRFGHKLIMYPATICGIIGLFLLSNTYSTSTLLVAGFFYGIAYGFLTPSIQTLAVSRVEKKKQGTANAMYLSFMDLGMALGSAGLGILAGARGYHYIYRFSIIFLIILLIVYTFIFVIGSKQKKLING